ncbi:MerR family glutamine synthetase transcriptional repressor [Orenia metallireducens]|jgi:MerR family glutamine synthetase transcriptional repressor|uniref:MerR family transcriptional regulator, glutamine synthetase repressor n=1 Tax=Orenia metallireducens TaxID=1413210 RepID=A0A285GZE3_9FIRM|nr:MerR family transcriptional regulator [Orenia metallireducens]PRX26490.1 MerR family glutamine synthetase transcriptional repressor [Orenia metallireducens]SNY28949.1 MerR family transcriptional regulator, glutamine synthetase repressor [Orenia metallireducens]
MAELDSEKPVYSIGVVQEKTGLTGRQIRYYEESELIKPARTKGNQRIYSQSDIEKLKEIKEMLEKGLNIAGIKEKLGTVNETKKKKKREKSKIGDPLYDGRPLTKFNRGKRGLTSLYPVSDRAQLLEILDKKDNDKDKD